MSGESVPIDTASVSSSSSLWDRVSTWASDNKVAAYTIAGTVVIITTAGVVYFLSDSKRARASAPSEKKKSKKERRLEKKAKEEQPKAGISLKGEEAGQTPTMLSPVQLY